MSVIFFFSVFFLFLFFKRNRRQTSTLWMLGFGKAEIEHRFDFVCSARGSKEGVARSLRSEIGRLGADLTEYKWMLVRFAVIQGLDILLTTVVVSRQLIESDP
jgi:hypothetical protein